MTLAEKVMQCYNTNNFNGISSILTPDCEYLSFWVFDTIVGNENIEEFLVAKSQAFEKANAYVTAKKVKNVEGIGVMEGQECIALYQYNLEKPGCLCFLNIRDEKISRIHLITHRMYQYEIVE